MGESNIVHGGLTESPDATDLCPLFMFYLAVASRKDLGDTEYLRLVHSVFTQACIHTCGSPPHYHFVDAVIVSKEQ